VKSSKTALQAIFYPANSESTPDNRDFCGTSGAKIHKCNRLLGIGAGAAFVAAAGGLSLPDVPDQVEDDKAQYAEYYRRHDDRRKICPNKIHVPPRCHHA
jgi:hypothetical protein